MISEDFDNDLKERFGNKTPFRTPKNYFEELEAKVEYSIQNQEAYKPQRTSEKLRPYLYLAAMFVGVAVIFYTGSIWLNNRTATTTPEDRLLVENIQQLDETLIYNEFMNIQSEEEIDINDEFNSISDYLINNNIAETTILNEL